MFVRRWLEALVERLTAPRSPVRRGTARGLGSSHGSRRWVVSPQGALQSLDLWAAIERLEDRYLLAATLTASLDGSGNLVIQDTTAAVNSLTLQLNATADSVVITDANETFAASSIVGATLSNSGKTMTVPLTSITGSSISIQADGGDDALTINLTNGNFAKAITYDGGTQTTSVITAVDGAIVLQGTGSAVATTTTNRGILINNSSTVSSTGTSASAATITMTGTGTGGAGTTSNFGIQLANSALVTSVRGAIALTGTTLATNTGGGVEGVVLSAGAKVTSTGTGATAATITLTGTGGGDGSVAFQGLGIQLTGTNRNDFVPNGRAIDLDTSANIASTGTATVTLIGDTIDINSESTITAGTNTVTLRQKTNGRAIHLGSVGFPPAAGAALGNRRVTGRAEFARRLI